MDRGDVMEEPHIAGSLTLCVNRKSRLNKWTWFGKGPHKALCYSNNPQTFPAGCTK